MAAGLTLPLNLEQLQKEDARVWEEHEAKQRWFWRLFRLKRAWQAWVVIALALFNAAGVIALICASVS